MSILEKENLCVRSPGKKVGVLHDPEMQTFVEGVLKEQLPEIADANRNAIVAKILWKYGDRGLYTSRENRIKLIHNAIIELYIRHDSSRQAVYPFFRRLLLLPQRPLAFCIYALDGGHKRLLREVFLSIKDPLFADKFREHLEREGLVGVIAKELEEHEQSTTLEESFIQIPDSSYMISLYEIDVSSVDSPIFALCKKTEGYAFGLIASLMDRIDHSQGAKRTILGCLGEKLKVLEIPTTQPEELDKNDLRVQDPEYLAGIERAEVELIREKIISPTFEEIKNSPLIKSQPGMIGLEATPFPNIFFMLSTATRKTPRYDGKYKNDLRILLPDRQKKALSDYFFCEDTRPSCIECSTCFLDIDDAVDKRKGCVFVGGGITNGEELVNVISQKLGDNSRSFCDSAFANGLVDFSSEIVASGKGKVFQYVDKGLDDREILFFKATACIFKQIIPDDKPRVTIFPVSVGATPWVAAWTVTKTEDAEESRPCAWLAGFGYAISIMSNVVNRKIRALAKRLYLKRVAEIFGNAHRRITGREGRNPLEIGQKISEANKELQALSYIYPFDQVVLYPTKTITETISIEHAISHCAEEYSPVFSLRSNNKFEKLLSYGFIEEQDVIDAIDEILRFHSLEMDMEIKIECQNGAKK